MRTGGGGDGRIDRDGGAADGATAAAPTAAPAAAAAATLNTRLAAGRAAFALCE